MLPQSDYKSSQPLFQSGSTVFHNNSLLIRNPAYSQQEELRHSRSKNVMQAGYSVIDMSMSSNYRPRNQSKKKKDKKKKHKHHHKSKHSNRSNRSHSSAKSS